MNGNKRRSGVLLVLIHECHIWLALILLMRHTASTLLGPSCTVRPVFLQTIFTSIKFAFLLDNLMQLQSF